ncbi:hypothetical protein BGZ47_000140 [Haplosporangium gracile]|nr:hypothetical protein BGZ47_000140 [Haplosporangium gracile]
MNSNMHNTEVRHYRNQHEPRMTIDRQCLAIVRSKNRQCLITYSPSEIRSGGRLIFIAVLYSSFAQLSKKLPERPRNTKTLFKDIRFQLLTAMRVARLSLDPKEYVIIGIDPGTGNTTPYEKALAKLKSKARFDYQFRSGQEKGDMVTVDQPENHVSPIGLVSALFDATFQ